ncbi:SDR family oxidoreductase [soil metagenome]
MKVLFIGGTGIISSACSQLCIERGIDLHLLNRGKSSRKPAEGAKLINADINDLEATKAALKGHEFDAVVNWISFVPSQIERDLDLFRGKTGQYVFISSASAYQTPPSSLPVTESTPLDNPIWGYSQNKIACEERLVRAYREEKYPITIVRPSHTYDKTAIPLGHGFTVLERMRQGKPVVVHGDGTSLWTLTHHADFAKGFVGLLGHSGAIGDAFHITSDEWLPWNTIYDLLAQRMGVEAKKVHIASDTIAAHHKDWGDGLLGDKTHSMMFDNSKVKRLVPDFVCTIPFSRGAEEIVDFYYKEDPTYGKIDADMDALEDLLTSKFA